MFAGTRDSRQQRREHGGRITAVQCTLSWEGFLLNSEPTKTRRRRPGSGPATQLHKTAQPHDGTSPSALVRKPGPASQIQLGYTRSSHLEAHHCQI